MADLLAMSSAVIDGAESASGVGPLNRINHELSEIGRGVAMVEAFSHSILFETDDGLVAFDTSIRKAARASSPRSGAGTRTASTPLSIRTAMWITLAAAAPFVADAADAKHPRPCVCGHANVAKRFDRYNFTNGYNHLINERQFGQFRRSGYDISSETQFLPKSAPKPDRVYTETMTMDVGGLAVELNHAKGETDDHTWAFVPKHKAICAGDFFIWNFPNAGNPQRCSVIRANGPPPCATWPRATRSFSFPRTAFPSRAPRASNACSPKWPRRWSCWCARRSR